MSTEKEKSQLINVEIIIVEKTGVLKETSVKEFKENELFKKVWIQKGRGFFETNHMELGKDRR